jgi:hypothetical protein
MNRQEHLLAIAEEECAEVAQRCSKALRFGLDEVQEGQPLNNRARIIYELTDLLATLEILGVVRFVDAFDGSVAVAIDAGYAAIDAKRAKIEKFLDYSASVGTLNA